MEIERRWLVEGWPALTLRRPSNGSGLLCRPPRHPHPPGGRPGRGDPLRPLLQGARAWPGGGGGGRGRGRYLRLMAMLSGPMIERSSAAILSPAASRWRSTKSIPPWRAASTTPRWSLTPRPPPWPGAAGGTDSVPLPRGHRPARREHGGLLVSYPEDVMEFYESFSAFGRSGI